MKNLHFFYMTERRNLFAFLAGKIDSLDLFSINDSDLSIDSRKDPAKKNFVETEIREIANPDYRKFKKRLYLGKKIIVFPRYQIEKENLSKENFLCKSTQINPWERSSIVHLKDKRKNFAMVEINFLLPQGAIRITPNWENFLKGFRATTYNQNGKNKQIIGDKVIIEKLGPLSRILNKAITDSNYLERFFSPLDWKNLISEDVEFCEVTPMKPENVDNNLNLSATAVRAKIQRIGEQRILRA